jgi:hypothetical protein
MPQYDDYVPTPTARLLEIIGATLIIVLLVPLFILADLVSGRRHPQREDREPRGPVS